MHFNEEKNIRKKLMKELSGGEEKQGMTLEQMAKMRNFVKVKVSNVNFYEDKDEQDQIDYISDYIIEILDEVKKELMLSQNLQGRNFVRRDRRTNKLRDFLIVNFNSETVANVFVDKIEEAKINFHKCILQAQVLKERRR